MIIKLLLEIVFTGFEIFKCHHANKLLLRNYKTNHWLQFPDSFAGFYAGVKRVSSSIVFTNKYTLFNHMQCIVSRQENVRHCNSATSLFFEWSKSDKALTQASKIRTEETDNPVIIVNTSEKTIVTSEEKAVSYNNLQKKKVAFKLNYLNNKKQDTSLTIRSYHAVKKKKSFQLV